MQWYMPCKLGEWYPETKFITWVNGTRVFGTTGRKLQMVDACYGMPSDHLPYREYVARTESGIIVLDTYNEDKWNFERFIMEISDSEFAERIIGKKKSRLLGVRYSENGLLGHYITCDRYEHFYEPIDIELRYTEVTDKQYFHFTFEEEKMHGEHRRCY